VNVTNRVSCEYSYCFSYSSCCWKLKPFTKVLDRLYFFFFYSLFSVYSSCHQSSNCLPLYLLLFCPFPLHFKGHPFYLNRKKFLLKPLATAFSSSLYFMTSCNANCETDWDTAEDGDSESISASSGQSRELVLLECECFVSQLLQLLRADK